MIITILIYILPFMICGHLDIDETNLILYDLEFKGNIDQELNYDETIYVKSKYGNEFTCLLPHLTYPRNYGKKNAREFMKNLTRALHPLKKQCLKKTEGWWTYEYCYKDKIMQYHVQDGVKRGMQVVLGRYSRDFDWTPLLNKPRANNEKIHYQFYTNGTFCDMINQPRETDVKFVCSSGQSRIQSVYENECRYALTIATPLLCSHPYFNSSLNEKTHTIECYSNHDAIAKLTKLRSETKYPNQTATGDTTIPDTMSDADSDTNSDDQEGDVEQGSVDKYQGKNSFRLKLGGGDLTMLNFLLNKVFKSGEDAENKRVHKMQSAYFKNHAPKSKVKKTKNDLIMFMR